MKFHTGLIIYVNWANSVPIWTVHFNVFTFVFGLEILILIALIIVSKINGILEPLCLKRQCFFILIYRSEYFGSDEGLLYQPNFSVFQWPVTLLTELFCVMDELSSRNSVRFS